MPADHYTISSATVPGSAGGTTVRFSLAGEFDLAARDDLRAALLDAIAPGALDAVPSGAPAAIVVDLDAVTFIDSEALGALIDAYVAARAAGRSLRLARPQKLVGRVLDIVGLRHLVEP